MITVIGGTYREIDYDDVSVEIFGSGFRAVKFLLENKVEVNFITVANQEALYYLKENQKVYRNLTIDNNVCEDLITFKYSYALDDPSIFPQLLTIENIPSISVDKENIIAFGMLELNYKVIGNKVVYDPQTSIKPNKFSEIGSANELIYIINMNEATSIASSDDIEKIKDYFFNSENVLAFIIKNGPYGATLYLKDKDITIPSYMTEHVNKIGSGDIFTSSFGYYWINKNMTLEESALNASKSTALYCGKKAYLDSTIYKEFQYEEFKYNDLSKKQVYLASPFFSISELILIDKIRASFLSFGIKVFSPFHDIGLGDEIEIAKKDVEGIENSDIIFCVLDNLDSGTLIEAGYSMSKGKKIVGYHKTCDENKLLMLKPADINFYQHLTTAIYQTIWKL